MISSSILSAQTRIVKRHVDDCIGLNFLLLLMVKPYPFAVVNPLFYRRSLIDFCPEQKKYQKLPV
jgi:hypothetical protein